MRFIHLIQFLTACAFSLVIIIDWTIGLDRIRRRDVSDTSSSPNLHKSSLCVRLSLSAFLCSSVATLSTHSLADRFFFKQQWEEQEDEQEFKKKKKKRKKKAESKSRGGAGREPFIENTSPFFCLTRRHIQSVGEILVWKLSHVAFRNVN